jgi:hypothetical protein
VHRLKVQRDALLASGAVGGCAGIRQQVHFRLQEAAAVIQLLDFEAIDALGKDIAAAIGVAVQHAHYLRGAADDSKAIALRAHNTEGRAGGDALGNHLAVPRLEDVERQRHSWKQHQIEREEGNFHACERPSCAKAVAGIDMKHLFNGMALRRLRMKSLAASGVLPRGALHLLIMRPARGQRAYDTDAKAI